MIESSVAIVKLRNIEELWEKLKGSKTNTPEYTTLITRIGTLSNEYQTLVELARKRV